MDVKKYDDDLHVKTVQSPIAISIRESQVRDDVKQLEFHGHSENDGKAFVENTGTSARVKFLQRNKQPYISGGVLRPNERYIFEELHFHWTDTNDAGCEHEINGQTYSMEAHLVHFNEKYGNFKRAMTKKDGIVVVAFFIHALGDKNCKFFQRITDQIGEIEEPHAKSAIDPGCLEWITLQDLNRYYYTYNGSLTTAPFNECVTWIIYQMPVFVSKQQVAVFRDLRSADQTKRIVRNCRNLQKIPSNRMPSVIFTRNIQLKSKL